MKKFCHKSAPTQENIPGCSSLAICALECTRKESHLGRQKAQPSPAMLFWSLWPLYTEMEMKTPACPCLNLPFPCLHPQTTLSTQLTLRKMTLHTETCCAGMTGPCLPHPGPLTATFCIVCPLTCP